MPEHTRANPPWWNHQRHTLKQLRRTIDRELDIVMKDSGGVVIDLGCGEMPYRSLIESRGGHYLGCDIDPGAPIPITAGLRVPLDDAIARAVVSFQVLEHVWDLGWYLGECRRLLSPSGRLLLSTHGAWLYHPHPTDYRRWTRDGLVQELEANGLIVERVSALTGPLAWTTQFRLLGYREVLRRIPIVRAILLPPLIVAMNLRMEIEDAVTPAAIRQMNACVYVVVARRAP